MSDQITTRRAVIVTALGLEYNAVRSRLINVNESTHNGTVYETGTFTTPTITWHVTILETGMGNANAAVETERAISQHHPDIVIFVGIAGGLKDAKIGDVVAATQVYGYESGKQADVSRPSQRRHVKLRPCPTRQSGSTQNHVARASRTSNSRPTASPNRPHRPLAKRSSPAALHHSVSSSTSTTTTPSPSRWKDAASSRHLRQRPNQEHRHPRHQ